VVDVTDIERPKPVAWYEPEYGGVHNVWVAGDTLYIGAYNAGFHVLDVSGELRGDLKAQGRTIAELRPADVNGVVPNGVMTWGVVVKDGLAYVNTEPKLDAVITDLAMPEIDGVQFTRQIRQRRSVPVIALTAFHQTYVSTEDFDAFLEKPVNFDKLSMVIKMVLGRRPL